MNARIRAIGPAEVAILCVLRAGAWRGCVPEHEVTRLARRLVERLPSRTVRHHLARYCASGLLDHEPRRGYRWNPDADPVLVARIEDDAVAEGLPLFPVRLSPPEGVAQIR